MSECSNCTMAAQYAARCKPWGGYSMACADCCARLVISARPLRKAQEAFLQMIAAKPGRPSKEQVIEAIQQADAAKVSRGSM